MKKKDLQEIKSLTQLQLKERVKKAKLDLAKLVMEKKQAKDKKAIFKKRKEVAQMLTVLRQKQLLEELESE